MIAAIVMAAGLSRRMGSPKLVLPWGETTVIGRVVKVLSQAGVEEIVVVTGGGRQLVEAALKDAPARIVFNPRFEDDSMALSLQAGLNSLPEAIQAALVVLGDQPQIEVAAVRAILQAYREGHYLLIVPSYRQRRGHPWLLHRSLWREVLNLHPPKTLRDFLRDCSEHIHYLVVDTDSVVSDLDTPEDYKRERPGF